MSILRSPLHHGVAPQRRRRSGRLNALGALAVATSIAAVGPAAAEPVPLALPFETACISSPFGPRQNAGPRASTFHQGIDLPAAAGTWVRAVAAGRVVAIRRRTARGLEIDIALPDGRMVRYAHLGQVAPALAEGRREVAQGAALGRVGRTGITYGTHLHLEVHAGGAAIDPAPFFRLDRCPRRGG
jgi:murein DD-endopeptidase MepM/ murein hydrolase activator NlpD